MYKIFDSVFELDQTNLDSLDCIRLFTNMLILDESTSIEMTRPFSDPKLWNLKTIWSISFLLQHSNSSSSSPWVNTVIEQCYGSKELALGKILQATLSTNNEEIRSSSIDAAISTVYHNWKTTSSSNSNIYIESLIVFLDSLIILAARGAGSGITDGWTRGVAGVAGLASGVVKADNHTDLFKDELCDVLEQEVSFLLPLWMQIKSNTTSSKQVNCTTIIIR
jgi:hypothetical protein